MQKREYVEEKHPIGFIVRYGAKATLFTGQSEFQKVEVVETISHGKMLLNDDLVMVTERDEFIYHDMITHVPLFLHPNPRRVLIIGGGDGGTAREVLRHKTVEHVDMVEIDDMVVEACRKFIPQTAVGMQDNPRFKLHIADGVEFVKKAKEKYDVVIVDSTDPIGPATPLFGVGFYQDVFNCLTEDGIVVSQGESPHYNADTQKSLSAILNQLFPVVQYFNFTNLTYPGGFWSFSYASKGIHPVRDFKAEKVKASGLKFKFYTADVHKAAFSLPQFQLDNIGHLLKG